MRDLIKPAASLLAICIVVGLCLSVVNNMTVDAIKQRAELDAQQQRNEVLPGVDKFEKITGIDEKASGDVAVKAAFKGIKSGKLEGFVLETYPKGYAGPIKVTVGISTDGKISGVKIGENTETPGLGSKAADKDFVGQFTGKSTDKTINVVKRAPSKDDEIQAISGATITSKAVTSGVTAATNLVKTLIKEGAAK